MKLKKKTAAKILYLLPLILLAIFIFLVIFDRSGTGGKSPLNELLFGYEVEGFVYYPISHRNYFFIVISIVLLMTLLLVIVLNISKKKSNLISIINSELSNKNKTIVSSINYGLMIQNKIIPSKSIADKVFENNFVIFYPKDIVSGDIYQFFKIKDTSYVVSIDCTGHGVPGAFLTIIATNSLYKILDNSQINSPKELLTKLSLEFIKSVSISESQNYNDSMAVSICSYCNNSKQLLFAGVNSKVMLIKNNTTLMLNGSKNDIFNLNETNSETFFTEQVFDLQKNDSFYLFSDGFHDQFGGLKNKKMGLNKLKTLLENNSKYLVSDQEINLKNEFSHWKGDDEQTDDVTLIGIKI